MAPEIEVSPLVPGPSCFQIHFKGGAGGRCLSTDHVTFAYDECSRELGYYDPNAKEWILKDGSGLDEADRLR